MFDVAQGHLCFHVLMFLLSTKRHLAGERICTYDFPFWRLHWTYRVKRRPSVTLYCTGPVENVPPVPPLFVSGHMGTWCQTTWWPSSTFFPFLFFFKVIFDCHWKDEWTLSSLCTEPDRAFDPNRPYDDVNSQKSQQWWSLVSEHRWSCMHFIGVRQSVITCKWSKNCTAILWKLWLRQDFVLVEANFSELMNHLKEKPPCAPFHPASVKVSIKTHPSFKWLFLGYLSQWQI